MLSDSPTRKTYRVKKRHTGIAGVGMPYTDNQKIEAIKAYLVTGNMITVAAGLGIPYETLAKWKITQWWKDMTQQIKTENTLKLSARLKSLAEKALVVTEDRIENGDWIYDQKTGELRRKPVSLRDVQRVAMDFTGKAIELEKVPVVEQTQTAILDRLEALRINFEKLGGKKTPVVVTDVIEVPVEVVKPTVEEEQEPEVQ